MMKNLYFFLFAFAITLTSCKPDSTPGEEQRKVEAQNQFATTAGQNDGFVATPVLPDMSSNTVNLLLNTFWVAERWVDHANNANNRPNIGRWWRFSPDGTFVTGIWEKTLSHGSWVMYKDQDKELLHLDAANDALDMEFEIQQIVRTGEYMSWVGTSTYKMSRIAVKAISLLSIPTKAQFGFQE